MRLLHWVKHHKEGELSARLPSLLPFQILGIPAITIFKHSRPSLSSMILARSSNAKYGTYHLFRLAFWGLVPDHTSVKGRKLNWADVHPARKLWRCWVSVQGSPVFLRGRQVACIFSSCCTCQTIGAPRRLPSGSSGSCSEWPKAFLLARPGSGGTERKHMSPVWEASHTGEVLEQTIGKWLWLALVELYFTGGPWLFP